MSCEERITSSACSSGESSSPKDAWIPPCAFDELFAWIGALRRERDPRARALGGDGGREPGGAAADHEHVESGVGLHHRQGTTPRLFVTLQSLILEVPSLGRPARIAPMPQIADVMRPDFIEVAPEDTLGEVAERMTADERRRRRRQGLRHG